MDERFSSVEMGNRIRKLRQDIKPKPLSQQQVADEMHLSRETFNTIENGRRALKDHEIFNLVRILDTNADFILRGNDVNSIDFAQKTGLSQTALSALERLNSHDPDEYREISSFEGFRRHVLFAVDRLLSSHEGRVVLFKIGRFLNHDYSRIYTFENVNKEEEDEEDVEVYRQYHRFINIEDYEDLGFAETPLAQETFEYAEIAQLTEALRKFKSSNISAKTKGNERITHRRKTK